MSTKGSTLLNKTILNQTKSIWVLKLNIWLSFDNVSLLARGTIDWCLNLQAPNFTIADKVLALGIFNEWTSSTLTTQRACSLGIRPRTGLGLNTNTAVIASIRRVPVPLIRPSKERFTRDLLPSFDNDSTKAAVGILCRVGTVREDLMIHSDFTYHDGGRL